MPRCRAVVPEGEGPGEDLSWCTPPPRMPACVEPEEELEAVPEGATMAVLLADGSVMVGDVERNARRVLSLRLLGHAPGVVTRIPHARVRSVCPVREHTWAAERLVAERQRRGLPALTLAPRGVNPG